MIKLKDSIKIDEKDDLTVIRLGIEMPIDDYKKSDLDVGEYPLNAWEVWVLKYHDSNNPSFEVCNKGLRVARNLTKEEKTMVIEFLIDYGYEKILKQESNDDLQ